MPLWRELFPRSRLVSGDDLVPAPRSRLQNLLCLPAYAWRSWPFHYAREAAGYDVYFACAPFLFEVFPASRLARGNGAALAVKVHHMVYAQEGRGGIIDRLFVATERTAVRLLNRCGDLILCSTPPVAADYNRLEAAMGLAPREIRCTGYGVDMDGIPDATRATKEFDAVLLGRLHEHKGILDAPAVWKRVRAARPDARLAVIGDGPHRAELERRFAEAGVAGGVTLVGGVSEAEKNRLVAASRVGLSLSREEGWGLSVHEFLAFGLPVVAMHLPILEHVFPGQLDTVPARDAAACADRILWWLDHAEAARERGVAGRAFAEGKDHRAVARAELEAMEAAVGKVREARAKRAESAR
jgi:glycosyltransferase involved in cell wall biosynthesis